jgi:hypothetical protein
MSKNKSGVALMGVTGLLQVAVIVSKLCGCTDLSWWWVLLPIWGTLSLVLLILLAALIIAVVRECKK